MALLVGTVHGGMGRGDTSDVPQGKRAAGLKFLRSRKVRISALKRYMLQHYFDPLIAGCIPRVQRLYVQHYVGAALVEVVENT